MNTQKPSNTQNDEGIRKMAIEEKQREIERVKQDLVEQRREIFSILKFPGASVDLQIIARVESKPLSEYEKEIRERQEYEKEIRERYSPLFPDDDEEE